MQKIIFIDNLGNPVADSSSSHRGAVNKSMHIAFPAMFSGSEGHPYAKKLCVKAKPASVKNVINASSGTEDQVVRLAAWEEFEVSASVYKAIMEKDVVFLYKGEVALTISRGFNANSVCPYIPGDELLLNDLDRQTKFVISEVVLFMTPQKKSFTHIVTLA